MLSLAELVSRAVMGSTHAQAAPDASSAREGAMPLVPTTAPSRERDPLTGGRCELAPIVLAGLTVGQGLSTLAHEPATTSTAASWH